VDEVTPLSTYNPSTIPRQFRRQFRRQFPRQFRRQILLIYKGGAAAAGVFPPPVG